jgi:hypothetical protein
MVLVGGQHRTADDQRPDVQEPARCGVMDSPPIEIPQDDGQRDVQGGCLIEGLVKTAQGGKQQTCQTVGGRLPKTETQRPQNKAAHRHRLRRQQAKRVALEFMAGAGQKQRKAVKKVDRPIWKNRVLPERNMPFPIKHHTRYLAPRGGQIGQVVGPAVAQIKQRGQQRQPAQRMAPGSTL